MATKITSTITSHTKGTLPQPQPRGRGRPPKVRTLEEEEAKKKKTMERVRVYQRNRYREKVAKPRKELQAEKDRIYSLWKEGKLVAAQ